MTDDTRAEPLAPWVPSRAGRVWVSLALFAVGLVVGVPAYTGLPSQGLVLAYRYGLPVLWAALALLATRIGPLRPFRPLLWSLFGVSLGLGLAYALGGWPLAALGLTPATPRGAAVAKLSEAIPMYAAILLGTLLAGRGLGSLSLRKGRLGLSLALGLLSAAPLAAFVALAPGSGAKALAEAPAATVLAWLPWVVLFSAANGLMEELWFRGAWFSTFREAVGAPAAMHVTSLSFAAWHVIIYWREPAVLLLLWPVFLYLGYACAGIVRKTGSLWGAVFGHTLADVMFLLVTFATSHPL